MSKHVLILGATGVVGNAALEHFVGQGVRVTAVSRRVPECAAGEFTHLSLDLLDTTACANAFARLRDVTHVVYAALFEKPGLIAGWQDQDQMQTNLLMLRNLLEPLVKAATELRHITLLQGTKAYGAHVHPIEVPAREDSPRDAHENFYWLQEDLLKEVANASPSGFDWTILRPQIVYGYSYGTAMNLIPILGVYGALCAAAGEPLHFPGGADVVQEAVDADLLAQVIHWAGSAPGAGNQVFNVTNGDVYHWRSLWPAIAQMLRVPVGEDRPRSLAQWLPTQAAAWTDLVQRHQLRDLSLNQILGESHHYADAIMGYGATGWQRPALLSTVKLRAAGFTQVTDTEAMFAKWFNLFRSRHIFP